MVLVTSTLYQEEKNTHSEPRDGVSEAMSHDRMGMAYG
jgi:hypothetical protein